MFSSQLSSRNIHFDAMQRAKFIHKINTWAMAMATHKQTWMSNWYNLMMIWLKSSANLLSHPNPIPILINKLNATSFPTDTQKLTFSLNSTHHLSEKYEKKLSSGSRLPFCWRWHSEAWQIQLQSFSPAFLFLSSSAPASYRSSGKLAGLAEWVIAFYRKWGKGRRRKRTMEGKKHEITMNSKRLELEVWEVFAWRIRTHFPPLHSSFPSKSSYYAWMSRCKVGWSVVIWHHGMAHFSQNIT